VIYIAIRHNEPRLFGWLVRFARGGDQSHTEAAVEVPGQREHWCVSSSYMDGGVRGKMIDITDPRKWRVYRWDLPHWNLADWLEAHKGWGYDILGLLGMLWRPFGHALNKMFCSEADASMIYLPEAELYDPRTLESVVASMGTRVYYKNGTWVSEQN
jgi:hypothetical protein